MTPEADGQSPKLLEQMRGVLRLHHYAIRTERAYCDWVRRYVKFHGMKSRADLAGGQVKVEAFLTDLAVRGQVSPSTQNQAFQALAFKWQRAIWRCWQDRTPYGEARYEAALRQAGSPVVALFNRVELGKSPWKNPAKKSQKTR